MVWKLDYMIVSCPFQLTNWNILSNPIPEVDDCGPFAHALLSSSSAVFGKGRQGCGVGQRGHQGWHSSDALCFYSLHGHSVGRFRHQLRLCLKVLQTWFVKCLCQICKLGFLKDVFYGFLCQHSHLMVQVDPPWHLISLAIFHLSDGREKLDKK